MTSVVISQPMLFPWPGLLEQIRLADVYVHYDDVRFSKGSFVNRVQVKLPSGVKWMTVPLDRSSLGRRIDELCASGAKDWRRQHLDMLAQGYRDAPYAEDMLGLVRRVYGGAYARLSELLVAGIGALAGYFGLESGRRFLRSSELGIAGESSRRVLDIVKAVGGDTYVTGHGARNYLDHELFEREGVRVEYIDYAKKPYPQLHGRFTPFVSSLDLLANAGAGGADYLVSRGVYWREFLE